MNNNSYNKDIEKKEKNINKKISLLSLLIVAAIILSFFGSYFFVDRLTNPKYSQDINEDKTVYNSTKSLDDEMMVILMNEGVVEKELSISEFKEENSISSEISEQFIVNFFEANGYGLESLEDTKAVFAKVNNINVLEPNKYYIGEKDGYFAIYKSDNDGNLLIESEEDVYSNSRPVTFLSNEDLEEIKTFKHYYDTKEEAVEKLSAYIS